jgi:multicomponent K+:H+ antiporter subunit C
MALLIALTTGFLWAGAVFLLLRRRTLPMLLGAVLLYYGVALLLFAVSGGTRATTEGGTGALAPLPQVIIMLALVPGAVLVFCLAALALRMAHHTQQDTFDVPPADTD